MYSIECRKSAYPALAAEKNSEKKTMSRVDLRIREIFFRPFNTADSQWRSVAVCSDIGSAHRKLEKLLGDNDTLDGHYIRVK